MDSAVVRHVDAALERRYAGEMIELRAAVPGDVPRILELVRALAEYEREPNAVTATEADFLRHGFGDTPRFSVLLAEDAEDGGRAVGFALYFFAFSTWGGAPILYLEDLFVVPEARKRGIGIALMKALAKVALDEGCKRFAWQVLDWNEPSIQFYESLGAEVQRQWLSVRIEGDALARLAGRG